MTEGGRASGPGGTGRSDRRGGHLVLLGLAVVLVLYALRCASFWHYVNDDAYITFRYTRFLALGRGPYFNVGEHVEGYTNFLLMLALVPVYWLGGEAALPIVAKLVGVASGLGSLVLAALLARRFLQDHPALAPGAGWLGVLAAAFVATSPGYALNSTSGLETTLFGFWTILGIVLSLRAEERGRWYGAGLAFAGLALTRPEGTVVFAAAFLGLAMGRALGGAGAAGPRWRRAVSRPMIVDGLVVAGAVAAHLTFRLLAYDGEWLPNTYYAKAGGFWGLGAWDYVDQGLLTPFLGAAGAGLGLAGALVRARRAPLLFAAIVPAVAGAALPFVTGTDWMLGWRLVVPHMPVLAALVVVGWATLLAAIVPRPALASVALVAVAVLASLARQWGGQVELVEETELRARGYATGHRELAEWLRGGAASPGDAVALMDIGIVGYLCIDQRVIDITGLTDRHIAKSKGKFLHKAYDPGYLLDKAPRFFVLVFAIPGRSYEEPSPNAPLQLWTAMERRLASDPRFQRGYVHHGRAQQKAETGWTDAFAAKIGARRVFEHAHPRLHYLLAVFERRP